MKRGNTMMRLYFEPTIGYKEHYTGCLEVPVELIYDDRLISSDRMVYAAVKLNCQEKSKKGKIESTASQSAVGRQLGLDRKTIQKSLNKLKDLGYVNNYWLKEYEIRATVLKRNLYRDSGKTSTSTADKQSKKKILKIPLRLLYYPELTPCDVWVYSAMRAQCNLVKGQLQTNALNRDLATQTGYSKDGVKDSITALERLGILEREGLPPEERIITLKRDFYKEQQEERDWNKDYLSEYEE